MSQPRSRHPLSWSDLAGRRVGVWGLGVEGIANLRAADRVTGETGVGVDVVAVDTAKAGTEVEGHPVIADVEALFGCDVVVKSPGISRYQEIVDRLEDEGVPVVGGHGLWLNGIDGSRVAAVTGTKGKSTTTAIVGHYFHRLGIDGAIGGNIGSPPYDPEPGVDPTYWCVELSSYQVTDLAVRPKVSVVTSLSPDHVEWHRSLDAYYRDKLSLLTLTPSAPDPVILAGEAGGELAERSASLDADLTWVPIDDRARAAAGALGVRGTHNEANVAMAIAIVEALTGDTLTTARLVEAGPSFDQLGSRLTSVATVDGVEFVDDCLSTNTLPTIAALDVFADAPAVLIAGGFDRGIDYEPLAARLSERAAKVSNPVLVLCLDAPDNGPAIAQTIQRLGPGSAVAIEMVGSVGDAVERGSAWCRQRGGGAVVLSPAAPTRGHALDPAGNPIPTRYPNYQAKAADFVAAVRGLAGAEGAGAPAAPGPGER